MIFLYGGIIRFAGNSRALIRLTSVFLPYTLERKYPKAAWNFVRQYVFPAKSLSKDPITGTIRRHHIHENNLLPMCPFVQQSDPASIKE
jgi:hypothetical protein